MAQDQLSPQIRACLRCSRPCREMGLIWPRSTCKWQPRSLFSLPRCHQHHFVLCAAPSSAGQPVTFTNSPGSSTSCLSRQVLSYLHARHIPPLNKHRAPLPASPLAAPPARHIRVPQTLTSPVQQQQQLFCESLDIRVLAYCSHDHTVFWN